MAAIQQMREVGKSNMRLFGLIITQGMPQDSVIGVFYQGRANTMKTSFTTFKVFIYLLLNVVIGHLRIYLATYP